MSNASTLRAWLSPLTAVAFAAIGLTGVLMFFHVRLPGITVFHEVIGLLFVTVGAIHVAYNARALLAYLRRTPGILAALLGVAVCVVALSFGVGHEADHQRGAERFRSDAPGAEQCRGYGPRSGGYRRGGH